VYIFISFHSFESIEFPEHFFFLPSFVCRSFLGVVQNSTYLIRYVQFLVISPKLQSIQGIVLCARAQTIIKLRPNASVILYEQFVRRTFVYQVEEARSEKHMREAVNNCEKTMMSYLSLGEGLDVKWIIASCQGSHLPHQFQVGLGH
jgi:hypothetical protein